MTKTLVMDDIKVKRSNTIKLDNDDDDDFWGTDNNGDFQDADDTLDDWASDGD